MYASKSRFRKKNTIFRLHIQQNSQTGGHKGLQRNKWEITQDQDQSCCWIRKLILFTHSSSWKAVKAAFASLHPCSHSYGNYSLAYFSQQTRGYHLFNITTSTAIHLDFLATSRGHEQPFPLLCSRASCCKSRSWLRSVAYDTSVASLSGCSMGIHFLGWIQDSLLLDTKERWTHTTQKTPNQ